MEVIKKGRERKSLGLRFICKGGNLFGEAGCGAILLLYPEDIKRTDYDTAPDHYYFKCVECKKDNPLGRNYPEFKWDDEEDLKETVTTDAQQQRCACSVGEILQGCSLSHAIAGHMRGITRGLSVREYHLLIGLCGKVLPGKDYIGSNNRCHRLLNHGGSCGRYLL